MRSSPSVLLVVSGHGAPAEVVSIDSGGHRQRVLAARDALVVAHLHLVHPIAARIHLTVPAKFELEDLEGAGYFGLLRAATRYRPRKHAGAPFGAFARSRIRGAILDSIRRKQWDEATIPAALDGLENFREPGDAGNDARGVEESIDERRLHQRLQAAIRGLPRDQREIIEGFCREQTAATIGAALGLAEWRVEREQAAAIAELRRRLAR